MDGLAVLAGTRLLCLGIWHSKRLAFSIGPAPNLDEELDKGLIAGMKRPIEITILGCLFILGGLLSLLYHVLRNSLDIWTLPISLVGLTATVCGIFLLRGCAWARWLLLAWLVFHVFVSAFHSLSACLAHLAMLIVIGYFLLASPASAYFRSTKSI
jgi:hypothetical protein